MTTINLSKRAALYVKFKRMLNAINANQHNLVEAQHAVEAYKDGPAPMLEYHQRCKASLEAAIERNVAEADKALAEIIDGFLPLSNNPPTIFATDASSQEIADAVPSSTNPGGPPGPQK